MISSSRTISNSWELDLLPLTRDVLTQDPDGTLVADPTKYIKKILETFKCTFGSKPKKARPLLEESDHQELDVTYYENNSQFSQNTKAA